MIYLDNSATTPLCESAKAEITNCLECFGNPSSLHAMGDAARRKIDFARSAVMKALGAKSGKLVFTSCGSEASNLALFGTVNAKKRRTANRIITTDSEHPSVENVMSALEEQGFEIVRLSTREGAFSDTEIEAALEKPVFMASIMLVNNETGAVYGVSELFSKIKRKYPEAVCHCDAVQGFLKIGFTPNSLQADMISISGHKIHAPKGVGALWVSDRMIKEKRLVPTLLGGGQENGFRSGTENTLGIVALGAASKEVSESFSDDVKKMGDLRTYAISKISELQNGVKLNIPKNVAAHIISLTLPNIKSQTMLNYLSAKGICVSSGSACSSHSNKPSSTLIAFGLTANEADCTIRVSISRYTEKSDIDSFVSALNDGVVALVRIRRR